ncbi:glycosyltransferase family 2 protein [Natrarchaeobius chitinivorans]|uniref:Glycosyltransferase family 2 protein n=1 Tax=Natrarchaeobius chitinivorans TaxID=1679083 RepID=A0A3N6M149_NATCH|nr:glycosyltransferase family A protein [Natrarchaeobius chitinivorans]RQG95377.1 glycosyltransferase family 2 protein [Natrarchaeobius chitinivorans]
MARITVVVPTYNRAETLPRALDSALEQTVDDIEVVVVDDGSSDRTPSVLAQYDDPRLRQVVHAANRGANAARNTGLERARGEYVAFLDSDDAWHPEKLERQLEILEQRSDEWVGAYCDATFDLSGPIGRLRTAVATALAHTDEERTMEGGDELIGEILADNVQPGAGSTLLVRTDVAREVGGFDEDLERFQDPEFCLRVLREGNLAYVDDELVVRDETSNPSADVVESANDRYLSRYADDVERFEANGYEIRSSHRLVLAKYYLAEGRFFRGVCHLRRSAPSPQRYPGICWAVATGVRRRPTRALGLVGLALAVLALIERALGAGDTAPPDR